VAIDLSEDGPRVIALVGAKEYVLKSRFFGQVCTGLKHFRRVSPDRKARYLRFFEKRYSKIRELLALARIVLSIREAKTLIEIHRPVLIVIDNKLAKSIDYQPKVLEDAPKPRYLNDLMTIADNLANYFRILLRNDPKRFREELERFEK